VPGEILQQYPNSMCLASRIRVTEKCHRLRSAKWIAPSSNIRYRTASVSIDIYIDAQS
jgi:hypothetical protein